MNPIRGLVVWLGAPLLSSLLCTTIWRLLSGGQLADGRVMEGIGLFSLVFTIGGSSFLSLLFAGMSSAPVGRRYLTLIGLSPFLGGLWLLVLGASNLAWIGGAYGLTTALLWVGLHLALDSPK